MSDLEALRRDAPDLFGEAGDLLAHEDWWDLWGPLADKLLPVPQVPASSVFNPFAAIVAANEYREAVQRRITLVATVRVVGAVHTWILRPLGAVLAAMHGRARSRSPEGRTGATVLWGALGAAFPLATTTVALRQGYARAHD